VRYRLEIPPSGGAEAARGFVGAWLNDPALRAIVELEGGTWPATSDLLEQAEALHAFSEKWDRRRGRERLGATGGDHPEAQALMAHAAALGLTAAGATRDRRYDHALVLGGTALANIYRVKRLFELRRDGIEIQHPAALTALREISEDELRLVAEREAIAGLAAVGDTEFDVMTRAVASFAHEPAHVTRTPNENPNLVGAEATVGDTLVLAAPSGDPGRRANTRDNYGVYTKLIRPGDAVLIVTSSVYLPYQFFIGLQALGWDAPLTVEAVGFPPEWMEGVLTGPHAVLQELRSALYGATMTLRALPGA
jgi:hypothetical protein